jgi:ABC-type multidrug transport system ATPase subunit
VRKVYPTLRTALDGVDLDIGPGVLGLLGPNGAGKSTLMAILAGELDFEAGSVVLNGSIDLRRHPARWRRRLGYVPQRFDLPPHLSGREFLQQAALLAGLSPRGLGRRIDALLELVHLSEASRRDASTYSRGMKQRLAVAASLVGDPDLLLLDEPTAGLDPEERILFRELLAEAMQGRLVVLSTHIVSDVERCCERLAVLAGGRICHVGAPASLLEAVEGAVWEAPVSAVEVDALTEDRRLVALRVVNRQPHARFVCSTRPREDAVAVAATLEDAYVHLLSDSGLTVAQVDA